MPELRRSLQYLQHIARGAGNGGQNDGTVSLGLQGRINVNNVQGGLVRGGSLSKPGLVRGGLGAFGQTAADVRLGGAVDGSLAVVAAEDGRDDSLFNSIVQVAGGSRE